MKGRISILAGLLLAACAHGPPATDATSRVGVTARSAIVPLIDAHQHMMGPAAMSTLRREASPPAVSVPPPVAALLRARESGVDEASFATLFTADAQVYAEEQGRWWTGRARILDSLDNFGSPGTFVPTSYAADGNAGYVAGVLRPASGEDSHNFLLGIRKDADGRWRIASEMKQRIMPPVYAPSIDAEDIVAALDDAGIRYATVLSTAYWFGDPDKAIPREAQMAGTRAENDWVIAQARRFPDRLIPFCGVNPVADYAVAEMERCAGLGIRGMKVHRNSKFDPARPADREALRRFFGAANRLGLAIVIHLRGDPQDYIDHVFPEAPDIPIQVAHMGSGWANARTFAEAIEAGRPGTRNLWFDWTQALPIEGLWGYGPSEGLSGTVSAEAKAQVVGIMRRLGLGRILFGTDMPLAWNPSPRDWWRRTILTLPLTDAEIADIADNLPPYARR